MILTFHGKPRCTVEKLHHAKESPKSITSVLTVLAFLSLVGGYVGLPAWLGSHYFDNFLRPVFKYLPKSLESAASHAHHSMAQELMMTCLCIGLAGIGIAIAYTVYLKKSVTPEDERSLGWFHKLIFNKYYVDEIYDAVIIRPLRRVSESFLWKIVDVGVIDGIVNGYATLSQLLSVVTARLQNGLLRSYLGWVAVGSVCILVYVMFFWS